VVDRELEPQLEPAGGQKRKTLQKTVVVHERIEIPPKGHSVN